MPTLLSCPNHAPARLNNRIDPHTATTRMGQIQINVSHPLFPIGVPSRRLRIVSINGVCGWCLEMACSAPGIVSVGTSALLRYGKKQGGHHSIASNRGPEDNFSDRNSHGSVVDRFTELVPGTEGISRRHAHENALHTVTLGIREVDVHGEFLGLMCRGRRVTLLVPREYDVEGLVARRSGAPKA